VHLPNQQRALRTVQAAIIEVTNLQIDVEGSVHTLIIGAVGEGEKLLGQVDQIRIPMDALFAANFRKQWQELADRHAARDNGAGSSPVRLTPIDPDTAG